MGSVKAAGSRGLHGLSFDGQSSGEVHDMADHVDRRISCQAGDKATHRVADQHVTGFDHFNDRVAVAGESGVIVDSLTVAGKIDS